MHTSFSEVDSSSSSKQVEVSSSSSPLFPISPSGDLSEGTQFEILHHQVKLHEVLSQLHNLRNSHLQFDPHGYPMITWPDKASVIYHWLPHLNSNPGGFQDFGFHDYHEFYRVSPSSRATFLQNAIQLITTFLGNHPKSALNKNYLQEIFDLYSQLNQLAHHAKS